ncbi:MAG: hypothetical protein K0R73_1080 [Candidatus Midichloriaceae bacterium]|jgi:hypothetical protein|nr:hypothetical protein [Candidatus Midichloriaceae bacterium]
MNNATKDLLLSVRVSESEHGHIKTLANQHFLSVSEYIRRRLFEEGLSAPFESEEIQNKFNCNHDQEVMRALVRVLALTKSLAKQSLPQEDFKAAYDAAKQQLQTWGYE